MLSFPNKHIVFHQKLYVARIGWKFVFLLKRVRILVKEHRDYYSLPSYSRDGKSDDTQRSIWSPAPFVEDSMSIDLDYFSLPSSSRDG